MIVRPRLLLNIVNNIKLQSKSINGFKCLNGANLLTKRCIYRFSQQKKSGQPASQQALQKNEQKFSQQQQGLIKSYQTDQTFNYLLRVDSNYNFQKQLIISKKQYEKSTKQLRASILFEDLLKTQLKILIYDTKAKPFNHFWMKNLFNLLFFALTAWFLYSFAQLTPKNKILMERTTAGKSMTYTMYGFATWFLLVGFYRYIKFQRRFVEKIIYDTQKQNFIITKRKFFGQRFNVDVSRFKLVYTQNHFLNKKGTNYFHLDTKQQYSIPYKQSWIKQDLFSHLIAQRIRV